MLSSDSLLIPVVLDLGNGPFVDVDRSELQALDPKKQAFLVHLQVGKLEVTVYTNEEFAAEEKEAAGNNDKKDIDDSINSDEVSNDGNEFAAVPVVQ